MVPRILVAAVLTAFSWSESVNANDIEKRSFSVPQSIPLGRYQDGPEALRKAYLKHGFEMPESLRLRKRQLAGAGLTGPNDPDPSTPSTTASEVAVTEKNDLEYLSPVDIGGTMMQLDFDTGSSDLYVAFLVYYHQVNPLGR
jgi:hypothetical protein